MKKMIIVIVMMITTMLIFSVEVQALTQTSAPYQTYTVGPNGKKILTQTAYEPAGLVNQEKLNNPNDMYIFEDIMYVADTGNKRIVKVHLNGQVEVIITGLNEPTGVHVDESGMIYVVDKADRIIKKYDAQGILIESFGRPTEPIFGEKTPFVPTKIATGPRGILYVIGEGSTGGVMQLNHRGEFLGFYGTNPTYTSFYRKVLEFFDVPLATVSPTPPENVVLDSKGSVYTISRSTDGQLKKFNISSSIVMMKRSEETPIAVYVNDFDNILTISETGMITEYDSYGNLIFQFGGESKRSVLGNFTLATDIVSDSNYNIYVLDKTAGYIQVLQRSEFTKLVHDGLISFKNGIYDIDQWNSVLRMNSIFALANSAIARAEYRLGNYESALSYYEIAADKSGYSDAFWQIRYLWLQQNLGVVFIVIIAYLVLKKGLKIADHKFNIYDPIRQTNHKLNQIKIIPELKLIFRMFKHPVDTYYEIKQNHKASYLSATILYVVFIILMIASVYLTGFIFNHQDLESYHLFLNAGMIGAVILLFVFANYMISTLSSGEGWFKDVYIATAYALAPYIILTVPMILLSRVLTLNELFIYNALGTIRTAWVAFLVVVMVKEVHNYTIKQLIKNLLLTIFTMIMIVVVALLLYLLLNQLYDYIIGIIKEVILRA